MRSPVTRVKLLSLNNITHKELQVNLNVLLRSHFFLLVTTAARSYVLLTLHKLSSGVHPSASLVTLLQGK